MLIGFIMNYITGREKWDRLALAGKCGTINIINYIKPGREKWDRLTLAGKCGTINIINYNN